MNVKTNIATLQMSGKKFIKLSKHEFSNPHFEFQLSSQIRKKLRKINEKKTILNGIRNKISNDNLTQADNQVEGLALEEKILLSELKKLERWIKILIVIEKNFYKLNIQFTPENKNENTLIVNNFASDDNTDKNSYETELYYDESLRSPYPRSPETNGGNSRQSFRGYDWDLKSALNAYNIMKGLIPLCISDDEKSDRQSSTIIFKKRFLKKRSRFENCAQTVTVKFYSEPSFSSNSSECSRNTFNTSSPSKLTFSKSDDWPNDLSDDSNKKLRRGISTAKDNVNLVFKARNEIAKEFKTSIRRSRLLNSNNLFETSNCTFILPDLSIHPKDFRVFLEQDLIEKSTLFSLESAQRLNWWSDFSQKLWPLATTGDGNCLLHAASLGMWGFHDRLLVLRKALHALLAKSSYTAAFYRRWKLQTYIQNCKTGLIFSESEWRQEWDYLLKIASTEPRVRQQTDTKSNERDGGKKNDIIEIQPLVYESLEEIHIFALAHVLRRPIVVIADTMLKDITGEAFFPILFGGIYLPLECPDNNLMKSPLCLTYDSSHFSALVPMDKEMKYVDNLWSCPPATIPLVDFEHNILPLQFVVDPGEKIYQKELQFSDEMVKRFNLNKIQKIKLLNHFFDITYIQNQTVERTLLYAGLKKIGNMDKSKVKFSEIEKSWTPSSFELYGSSSEALPASSDGRGMSKAITFSTKAAKQLITKRFGFLGRMCRRIKKHLRTIVKSGTSSGLKNDISSKEKTKSIEVKNDKNSRDLKTDTNCVRGSNSASNISSNTIISALLQTDRRHIYYDEMIRNYLNTARAQFLRKNQYKNPNSSSNKSTNTSKYSSTLDIPIYKPCVNIGFERFGTAHNNYLCSGCFAEQKQQLHYSIISHINSTESHKNSGS